MRKNMKAEKRVEAAVFEAQSMPDDAAILPSDVQSTSEFALVESTVNSGVLYSVSLSLENPTCECNVGRHDKIVCKHIAKVMLKQGIEPGRIVQKFGTYLDTEEGDRIKLKPAEDASTVQVIIHFSSLFGRESHNVFPSFQSRRKAS